MIRLNSLPIQHRFMSLKRDAVNVEERTIELVASTEETIVDRWWGREQLVHEPGAIVMDRAQSEAGIAALWGHDVYSLDSLLGRVESFELDAKAKVTRAKVRLATTEDAEKALTLIRDGALRDVSIGYRVLEITVVNAGKPDEIYRISSWEPVEVSFVSVPADPKAGIGRAMGSEYPVRFMDVIQPPAARPATQEVRMDPENGAAPQAPQPTETPAPQAPAPQVRALITPEVRAFLADAEKVFGTQGRAAAEEILGQVQDLGRAGAELLKRFASKPLPPPAPSLQDLGASERELQGYSYARALAAVLDQAEGRQAKRGFEHEVSDTLIRSMPVNFQSRGGIILPLQVRTLVTGTATAGKELVFAEKGELIDLLRNMAVSIRMGARFLSGLSAPITFPKITGGATASWVAENSGTDVADSELTTGTVTLSPKTLQASTPISRQLLYTSSEDAEAMIRKDLAQAHALTWDKAVLHGTGTNLPTGIYAASGVNAVAMGGAPTFGKLVDMVTEIAKDNALLGTLGYVTTPGMAGKLMQTLVASAAGSDMIWKGKIEDGLVNGYKAMASNQVAANLGTGTNEHGLVCADWAQVIIGQFGPGFELILDPYAKKKQGLVEFTSFEMVDMVLRYAEAFCKATGATI